MASKGSVLVTGGAGYIGSHACKALAGADYTPVVYDNLVYGHRWAVKWGPLEEGELADRAKLDALLDRHRPVAAMHFAAYTAVGESVIDPGKYYRNNVAGSLTLLEALRDHEVRAVIFSSTAAAYGIPERVPIPEEHPEAPINPYGASKLMIERMLRDFGEAHGIRSVCLRYFNAAGADPDGELGEDHSPETHLIPLVVQAALGRRPHIEIFGTDYSTPDGTAIRDYIHVTDLVDVHMLALERLLGGGGNAVFNVGTGTGHSVREVIATVERVGKRPVPAREGPRRAGDPPSLVADPRRAREVLGWAPRRAELEAIVETAWRWHSSR